MAGEKLKGGFFHLTNLHRDDIIEYFAQQDIEIKPEDLSDDLMSRIADHMVQALFYYGYWEALETAYNAVRAERAQKE